jgi:hypothetical protein
MTAIQEPINGWQPIETAPKDGTTILLYCPFGTGFYLGWWSGARFEICTVGRTEYLRCDDATYWMPLLSWRTRMRTSAYRALG